MPKFFDKFLDSMKLYDDDEDLDDDFEEEEEEERESVPHRFLHKKQEPAEEPRQPQLKAAQDRERDHSARPKRTLPNNVVPMKSRGGEKAEVCMIRPTTLDDAREVCDTLLAGRIVVINMEGVHVDLAQRIIDFTSGSCFSISGNLQKISKYIFIVTPPSITLSGDFQDILEGSQDLSNLSLN